MGFTVVSGSPQAVWGKVSGTDTLYTGQIVEVATGTSGLVPIGAAAGIADTTGLARPFGVVKSGNDKAPTFNSTYKGNSITGVITQALQNARSWVGVEGANPKRDPAAYVLVDLITPDTILKGRLFNNAYGTAPTVQTITTIQTDGMATAETWSSPDVSAFLTLESTIYMRSGLNKGIYRNGINTVKTAPQVTHQFPFDNTTNDTGIQVPVKELGPAKVQFDGESTYVDISVLVSTTIYYIVDVLKIDLSTAGEEHIHFKFTGDHFDKVRA